MTEIQERLVAEAKNVGIVRFVVGGVIVDSGTVLLLHRPKNEFMGRIYELPSGKVEEGETLFVALLREVKEETNLDVKEVLRFLDYFDYESKSGKKTRQFNFLVSVKNVRNVVLTEHDDFVWASKARLDGYAVTDSVKKTLSLLD